MTLLPADLAFQDEADGRRVIRWGNPPSRDATISPHEAREIALALLDAASTIDNASEQDERTKH